MADVATDPAELEGQSPHEDGEAGGRRGALAHALLAGDGGDEWLGAAAVTAANEKLAELEARCRAQEEEAQRLRDELSAAEKELVEANEAAADGEAAVERKCEQLEARAADRRSVGGLPSPRHPRFFFCSRAPPESSVRSRRYDSGALSEFSGALPMNESSVAHM